MVEKKVLHLSFTNAAGKATSVSVTEPKEGLTLADVKAVGELIASKAVFEGTDGPLVAFKEAHMVTTKVEPLA